MIVNANALTIPLADASVQCCVTSPPYYGLRDYGVDGQIGLEHTPEQFIANLVAVGREVWRVLADDGVFFLNIGDSYNGYPGNVTRGGKLSGTNQHSRQFKPSGYGLAAANLKPKDLMMIPARVAIALQADGWYIRAEIVWAKPNPMPESVTDRPTRSHEMIYLLTKRAKYFYNADAVRSPQDPTSLEPLKRGWNGNGERGYVNGPQNHLQKYFNKTEEEIRNQKGANQRDVWTINTESYTGAHYATFPTEIPRRAILAGSKPGDIVLDPFCGSGTTGEVCRELGRRFIGLDLSMKYLTENALPRAEMKQTQASIKSLPLFGGDATIALSEMTP